MGRLFLFVAVAVVLGGYGAPAGAWQAGVSPRPGSPVFRPAAPSAPVVAPPVAPSPRPVSPPARSATRTLRATIVSVDAAARTLQLREDGETGRGRTVFADPGAQYHKNGAKSGVGLSDFAPGESVAARVTFRAAASANGGTEQIGLLRALWDTASYEAENRARREICVGTVTSWGRLGDTLTVRRASDGEGIAFRVTAKTILYRGGVTTLASAFPVGAPVAVKPRALPSGDLMAAIIAETERDALAAYGDGLRTWAGEVAALDEQAGTLTLRRDDGAVRTVALISLGVIKRGRAQITPPRAVIGLNVRVHLEKETDRNGLRVADSVAAPTRNGKKPAPGNNSEFDKR